MLEYKRINDLTAAGAQDGTEILEVEQAGISKKISGDVPAIDDCSAITSLNLTDLLRISQGVGAHKKIPLSDFLISAGITSYLTSVNASFTISSIAKDQVYVCTAGTNGIFITGPAAPVDGTKITFIKDDSTNSAVTFYGNGKLINDMTYIFLILQFQRVTMIYTGSAWRIIQGSLIADTGYVGHSDWLNVHLGCGNIIYDGKGAAPFSVGELVKEATSLNTGIVIADSGGAGASGTLTIWRITGTGIWTNDRVITGQISGVTANVNNAGTTKNIDTNFYHGFIKNIRELTYSLYWSSDGTENNAVDISKGNITRDTNPGSQQNLGLQFQQVDTNNILIQTADTILAYLSTSGAASSVGGADDFYRGIIKWVA